MKTIRDIYIEQAKLMDPMHFPHKFMMDKPEEFIASVSQDRLTVTTWSGFIIGHVFHLGEVRRNSEGRWQYICILGINDIRYNGRYFFERGNAVNLKAMGECQLKLKLE